MLSFLARFLNSIRGWSCLSWGLIVLGVSYDFLTALRTSSPIVAFF